MHCSMEELIAIRDGEGHPGAISHLEECEDCMLEMEALHQRVASLRALPSMRPARDRWDMVRAAVMSDRRAGWLRRWGWAAVGAAASMVFMLGFQGYTAYSERQEQVEQIEALMARTAELEAALEEMESRKRVINGRLAGTVLILEDRINEVDVRLQDIRRRPQVSVIDVENLLRQRVRYMDALVNAHATRATNVGF